MTTQTAQKETRTLFRIALSRRTGTTDGNQKLPGSVMHIPSYRSILSPTSTRPGTLAVTVPLSAAHLGHMRNCSTLPFLSYTGRWCLPVGLRVGVGAAWTPLLFLAQALPSPASRDPAVLVSALEQTLCGWAALPQNLQTHISSAFQLSDTSTWPMGKSRSEKGWFKIQAATLA